MNSGPLFLVLLLSLLAFEFEKGAAILTIKTISHSFDNNLMNHSVWKEKPKDKNDSTLTVTMQTFFYQRVKRVQDRFKVFLKAKPNDTEFTNMAFQTVFDTCGLGEGSFINSLVKTIFSNGSLFNCPLEKNVWQNYTFRISDSQIPLIRINKEFKFKTDQFGMVEGRKGWTFLYTIEALGSIKK